MRRTIYLPEGSATPFPPHQPLSALQDALAQKTVLTGTAVRCDRYHDLWINFGGYEGIIPRSEAVHPSISGAERDISVLSLVGKQVSFTISELKIDGAGRPRLVLSRRSAQEQAFVWLLENTAVGSVVPAQVTSLASFGAFVDLGCGIISLIPLENLSIARSEHPSQRLHVGQKILTLLIGVDTQHKRFYLSHKELLGTWLENAAAFTPGDTVTGIVRGIKDYGIFIELTPNLSGLAQWRDDLSVGDAVTVYIRSIRPESHKIKLQVIQKLNTPAIVSPPKYFITDGVVHDWVY
ncbi:MAG: 30S ribosomal protein S1 [Oscillospiraceae bacterium]|nr:30S ribosomal protein S1 [Oscillospiraceae bacterium]